MSKQDRLFAAPLHSPRDFEFDENVAAVFDDMITRSVPQYQAVQSASARLASKLCQPGARVYDLGCSTGTTILELSRYVHDRTLTIVGVDNSAAMLSQCEQKLRGALPKNISLELIKADLSDISIGATSLVLLNYTLQFIQPERRAQLLHRIYRALDHGGALLLSEKVCHRDARMNRLLQELHFDCKRAHGYSELEIAQKRDALEEVLIPLTVEENLAMLRDAGFERTELYLKWYNFASIVAIK